MIEIRVPKMGMSTVEVDIVAVSAKPGDRVAAGQILGQIEAEKANVEIEAEADGVVTEVLTAEGESRQVGDVLFRLQEDGA